MQVAERVTEQHDVVAMTQPLEVLRVVDRVLVLVERVDDVALEAGQNALRHARGKP